MAAKEDAYVELFLAEARDHLEGVEKDFIELESNAEASGVADKELLNRIFRAMHTIKGGAGMVGMVPMKTLAHSMESVLSRMRDGSCQIRPAVVSTLLEGVDLLRFALDNHGGGDSFDPSALISRLESALAGASQAAAKQEDDMAWFEKFQKDGMCVLPEEAEPALAPTPIAVPEAEAKVVPIREALDASPAKQVSASAPMPTVKQGETLRVRVELLDQLMSLAGELVLVRNQHMLAVDRDDPAGRKLAARLNQVTTELQETVMRTRMQPMSLAYGKLSRLVRDLGKSLGKNMRFETVGEEVELDKTILEALTDPLMHLTRNSCDHGVESPESRSAAGKDPVGRVFVRAQHEGGQMHIEVGDDGKGIDPEAIRASALRKGIRSAEEVAKMSPGEILNLIFTPGFSTAAKVTDVSGRGVGMDVVQTAISALGGVIEIESRPGVGATFHLRLPLTLAIIPSLIIRTSGERFAIPQVNLEECVRLYGEDSRAKIEIAANSEVYRLRDRLLPVVRLREVLRRSMPFDDIVKASIANAAKVAPPVETLNILVLKCGSSRFGLVVDEIVRNEDIVVTPMHSALKSLEIFAGTTIMGDGQVSLIFDIHGLARHAGVDLQVAAARRRVQTEDTRPGWRRESLLLFKAGPNEQFAIPLSGIKRVEHLPVSRFEAVGGQKFVTLDNVSTRVVELDRHLRVSSTTLGESAYLIIPRRVAAPVAILASTLVDVGQYEFHMESDLLTGKGFAGRAVVRDHLTLFPDVENIIDASATVAVEDPFGDWKEAAGDA